MKKVAIFLCTICLACSALLATTDFSSNVAFTKRSWPNNFAGLSLNYPQLSTTTLGSSLFRNYIKNSWTYGTTRGSWGVSLKMQDPIGYKYNCFAYMMFDPFAVCTRDISMDMTAIGAFFKAATNNYEGISMGFDMQAADFTNSNFNFLVLSDFAFSILSQVGYIGVGTLNVDLYDQADLFVSKGVRTSFSPAQFI